MVGARRFKSLMVIGAGVFMFFLVLQILQVRTIPGGVDISRADPLTLALSLSLSLFLYPLFLSTYHPLSLLSHRPLAQPSKTKSYNMHSLLNRV